MASLFFFAVGMIFAGRWQDKAGPRKVAIFGGLLLGAGAILAGAIGQTIGGMVFAYGILGGLGVGFAYVTPIATCIKWFPDMRGTITGLAVFGFGAGTLVFGPLINKLVGSIGVASTFYTLGVIFIICVCGAGSFFKVPPAGYKPAGWTPPAPAPGARKLVTGRDGRRRPVRLLWIIYFFGAAAG
jgi:OFA family oxalate/formate antiporter-like MFS transporter